MKKQSKRTHPQTRTNTNLYLYPFPLCRHASLKYTFLSVKKKKKPVREVTLSVWKVMLHLRRAWLGSPPPHPTTPPSRPFHETGTVGSNASAVDGTNRNPPLGDPAALEFWKRAWAVGGLSGPSGDTLHRWVNRRRRLFCLGGLFIDACQLF